MNITVEKQPNCKATLKVEIPADKVNGQRQSIVSKYAGQARVPGFRPGKAPSNVIEKRFEPAKSVEKRGRITLQLRILPGSSGRHRQWDIARESHLFPTPFECNC